MQRATSSTCADVGGLRNYLDSIEQREPALHAALAPRLEALESRRTWATTSLIAGLVLGAGVIGVGLATQEDCDPRASTREFSACSDENQKRSSAFVGAGIVLGVAGALTWVALKPGRSDLLEIINEHNRIAPQRPLRIKLGYDPERRYAGIVGVWRL